MTDGSWRVRLAAWLLRGTAFDLKHKPTRKENPSGFTGWRIPDIEQWHPPTDSDTDYPKVRA